MKDFIFYFNLQKKRQKRKQVLSIVEKQREDKNKLIYRTTVVGVATENGIVFSLASCSPKDQFSKKAGRMRAFGRLAKGKLVFNIPVENCLSLKNEEVRKTIEENLIKMIQSSKFF